MKVPDYGRYTSEPPTTNALAIRDSLAEEMAAASKGSPERHRAEERLVGHMLTDGLPLEDFSTRSGRTFVVRVAVSPPRPKPGREKEAHQWLARQEGSSRTIAHKLLERGGGLPADLFEPLNPRVHVEPK